MKTKRKQQSFLHKTVTKLVVLGVSVALLVLLILLKNNRTVCEFFATTFSRAWILVFGNVFGVLPFSAYELFLICAIVGTVVFWVFVIVSLCKRRWKKLLSVTLAVAIAAVCFANIYTATASMSYNRASLPDEVYTDYDTEIFTYEEAVSIAEGLVEKLNEDFRNTTHDEKGNVVYPFTFDELSVLLAQEYARLPDGYFSAYTPRGKRILNKRIMSELHISGVFFAPFGEANVNGNETSLYLPLTLAHEMAHGKGVMREYEADLVALYVTLTSDNPYLRYGSLVKITNVALALVAQFPTVAAKNQYPMDKYRELLDKREQGIGTETKNYSDFYRQFTLLSDVGNFFNDIYLKLQNQQGGVSSYTKPSETIVSGEKDDAGRPIIKKITFSGTENLLLHLVRRGLL